MFGWLKQKVNASAVASQEKELLTFIQSLKGMTQDELASLLVMATRQRFFLPSQGIRLTECLDGYDPPGYEAYALKLGSAIRQLQKDGDFAAAGSMMIWIHSVRAVLSPPLRIYGKHLWLELMRGFPRTHSAWCGLVEAGLPLGSSALIEADYVPNLLDPRQP